MSAEQHNEFITRTVKAVGQELLDQGNFAQQMVALESLIAGLFATSIMIEGKTQREANGFLSALTHGVRGRLQILLKKPTGGEA
jgi:hypothetical protein